MKNNYFRHLVWCVSVVTLLAVSCTKNDVEIVPPLDDNSLPSAAVSNIAVIEKTDKFIRFSVRLAVFKDSKNMDNQLKAGHFVIDTISVSGNNYAFSNLKTILSGGNSTGNYSALMLMDQSGSISSTDPNDYRLDAAKTFTKNIGANNNAWLWSFNGSTFKKYGENFSADTTTLLAQIEALRNQEGGSTPLYRSQYNAIEACASKGDKQNKVVLTFTDGDDTEGGYTNKQVSDFAVSKSVRLYNIGLGAGSSLELLPQAMAANGAFIYAKDARQLISMFGNLGKLLDLSAKFYDLEWRVNSLDSGIFTTGTMDIILKIKTPYNYTIEVPLRFKY